MSINTSYDHLNLVRSPCHLPRPPCAPPSPAAHHSSSTLRVAHGDDADLIPEPRDDNFAETRVPAAPLGRDDSNEPFNPADPFKIAAHRSTASSRCFPLTIPLNFIGGGLQQPQRAAPMIWS